MKNCNLKNFCQLVSTFNLSGCCKKNMRTNLVLIHQLYNAMSIDAMQVKRLIT